MIDEVADASATSTQRGNTAEHERDATNNDASDHAAAVLGRAPIYHIIDVERPSHKYRNQECIAKPSYAIHDWRRNRRQVLDPE